MFTRPAPRRFQAVAAVAAAVMSTMVISHGPPSAATAAGAEFFATSVDLGFGTGCATTGDGQVLCWGSEADGGLGNGAGGGIVGFGDYETAPVPALIDNVVQNSAQCAVTSAGDVSCWGFDGVIEDGEASLFSDPPWGTSVPTSYGFGKAEQVAGGCARLTTGRVQCYGWNRFGQLGNGSQSWPESGYSMPPPSSAVAVNVVGLVDVVDITAGFSFMCAAKQDGSVWCWGENSTGSLGNGDSGFEVFGCNGATCTDSKHETSPVQVIGIDDALDVEQNCAIRVGGVVSCWGQNTGGRFDPTAPQDTIFTPVDIPAFAGARDLAVSFRAMCATLATGAVACQGSGPLGDGVANTNTGSVELDFGDAREVVMSSFGQQVCVRSGDGSIACWGSNNVGQLGVGFVSDFPDSVVLTPTNVVGFAGGGTPPPSDAPTVASLDPGRILDTRPNGETTDGDAEGDGRVAADSFVELDVFGRGGVPSSEVAAVILNVTAINPSDRGFVTAYPCGDRPTASSLNYPGAGGVIANELIAKVSDAGTVCLYTSAETHLAADVVGFLPASSDLMSLDPARLLDTRPTGETVEGVGEAEGRVEAGTFANVQVTGRAGVPSSGVAAVILNVTAINPSDRGFVTAYPCGDRPTASSLNYPGAGGVIANELVAKVSDAGTVCLYTSAETHLAADVVGYLPTTSSVTSFYPARLLDTRTAGMTVDGDFQGEGRVPADDELVLDVVGRGGVPSGGVGAVILNVTAINPSDRGFVTAYPCGDRPTASSLNFAGAGGVIANELVAKVSDAGTVCLYTSADTDLAADVVGFVPA